LLGASGRGGIEGGVAALAPVVVVAGQAHATFEPRGLVQGWFSFRPRVAVFAGASARGEVAPDATFLTLAPRLAVRLVSRRGLSFAFLAEAPLAGSDRTDAIVAISLGYQAPAPAEPKP
jgi:hypothetical protein